MRAFAVERLLDHLNVIRIAAQRQIAAFRTVMREQRPRSVIGEQNHALAGKQYQTFIHTGRNVVKLSLTALQLVHLRLNFVVLLVHAVQQRRQLVIGFALHRLMQVERFDRLEEQTGQPASTAATSSASRMISTIHGDAFDSAPNTLSAVAEMRRISPFFRRTA